MVHYRIDLRDYEYENLMEIIACCLEKNKQQPEENALFINEDLLTKLNTPKHIKYSAKKSLAAESATKIRVGRVKEKIDQAAKQLRRQGKEPTPYQVSKLSGVAFQTAKKYLNSFKEI